VKDGKGNVVGSSLHCGMLKAGFVSGLKLVANTKGAFNRCLSL